jgi:hypothetical protein
MKLSKAEKSNGLKEDGINIFQRFAPYFVKNTFIQ